MPLTEWFMQGTEFGNCNCSWGCPCQFNALPTHGNCRAHSFFQIEKGRFGETSLDGVRWGILAAWPGPIHEGRGVLQLVVDERADAGQRAAIEAIAQGRETEAGKLITQVFTAVIEQYLPTLIKRIDLTIDVERRTAKVTVPGLIESTGEPIRNPVTGEEHRVSVSIPNGFEFAEAEFASGKTHAAGPIPLDFDNTHVHLAHIHWSTHGVVH